MADSTNILPQVAASRKARAAIASAEVLPGASILAITRHYGLEVGPAWTPCPPLVMAQRQANFAFLERVCDAHYRGIRVILRCEASPALAAFTGMADTTRRAFMSLIASTVAIQFVKTWGGGEPFDPAALGLPTNPALYGRE